jgi:Uma2 family endonuclease
MTAALGLSELPDKQDWTVDDLASLPKDLRYELIDGRLILPSPTALHQILGVEVLLALRAHCPPDLIPVVDLSLDVNHRNEPRPDVVVIKPGHLDLTPLPVGDAVLVVEVISPGSHFRDMIAKVKVYAAAGVEHYWVIDPLFDGGMVLTQFRLRDTGEYEVVGSTDKVFTTDEPYRVTIDLPALTARRKALLERPHS